MGGEQILLVTSYGFDKTLDDVGPVDNQPSTNKLHHFVKKEM